MPLTRKANGAAFKRRCGLPDLGASKGFGRRGARLLWRPRSSGPRSRSLKSVGPNARVVPHQVLLGFRFFDPDLMIMRVVPVRGNVTPECLIAALINALISP